MRAKPRTSLPLVVTIITWGLNFVAVEVLYRQMTAPALALLRFFVMWACLVLACVATKNSLRAERRQDWPALLYFGFVAMGVYMVLFLGGMKNTSADEGAIVLATTPIFTLLGSIIVKQERFRAIALVGSVVSFVGVAIVVAGGSFKGISHVTGNLLVLASAIVWAHAALMMRQLLKAYSPLRLLTLSMPGALPVLLVYGLRDTLNVDFRALNLASYLSFAHIAIGSGVIGFVFFYRGIRDIGATRAVNYQYFTPLATVVFSMALLGSRLEWFQVIGAAVVIGGLLLARVRPQVAE